MASKAPRIILPKAEPGWASASSSPTLDSIPPGSDSPAKRRCISSACMPCRKRKSKCDGKQPKCNACKIVYSTECHYDLDADHRRKGALKRDIVRLKGEKSLLRSIIDSIKNGSEADVDDIVQIIRTSEPDASDEALAESVKIGLQKHLEPSLEALPSLEGELVSNFALRPSLDKTGESRHYGLTSNLSLQPVDEERSTTMPADQSGAWTMVTSDRDLINHLLEVYFAWSHPWYLLFSEEIFFHGMHDHKAKYCTPLLMNAILAVGCHYSDRPEARADPNDPSTVGDHFFAEAQRLLMEDDNRSSLTIVQALGLMSLHQAKNNHDSSGRRYIAQMMSMAIELGLHISQGAQPSKITPSEIEARRLTFWGCFVLETAWSIAIGRISSLPRTAIRLEKPTLIAKLENTPWKPYGTPTYDRGSSELAQPSMKYSVLLYCSILSEIVDDIIHLFYAPRDRITSRKLQLYHEKLSQWYTDLPPNLLIRENGPTLPQIITLHCYYHNCIIHLFRPFLKVSFVQSSKPPRQICTEAANSISQLLGLHSQTYGLRRSFFINTHCLMTAAIIHLVNISSTHATPWRSIQTESYLAEAIRGLHDMKGSFICVGRYLHIIRNLVHKWCQDVPLRVREALDETYLGSPTSSTSMSLPNPPSSSLTDRKLETATNGTKYDTHFSDRKHSAPEVLLMAPQTHLNLNGTKGTGTPQQQDLFWSPYDTFEGVPLAIPQENNHLNTHMDITSVLDSGINGDWPQWNRDGFMMGAAEDGPLWGINWDRSSSADGVGK